MSTFLTGQSSPQPYTWQSQDCLLNGTMCLIRTARQHDLSTLATVLTECFHPQTGMAAWMTPIFRLGIYEDLRHRFYAREPHAVCLVAVDAASQAGKRSLADGAIAGTVELSLRYPPFWSAHRQRYLYISNLAVHPDYRRQGVAKRLLYVCEQIALDWGYTDLYLHVLDNNDSARQLYRQTGFMDTSTDFRLSAFLFRRPQQMLMHRVLQRSPISDSSTTSAS